MADSEDKLLIATSCLLRATDSRVSVPEPADDVLFGSVGTKLSEKEISIHVYRSLLPDLAKFHRQKFTNFLRMDVDDFEELFRLVEPAIKKKTNCDRF